MQDAFSLPGALAERGLAPQPGRLDRHHGPQPGRDRPYPPRADIRAEAESSPVSRSSRRGHVSPYTRRRLALVSTCCHPALAAESRAAPTLRGWGPDDRRDRPRVPRLEPRWRIASSARSVVGRAAGFLLGVPPDRPPGAAAVGALCPLPVFNEGHGDLGAAHVRGDPGDEAIRLAKLARTLGRLRERLRRSACLPAHAVPGLAPRRGSARTGELVLLKDQTVTWDEACIAEGHRGRARTPALRRQACSRSRPHRGRPRRRPWLVARDRRLYDGPAPRLTPLARRPALNAVAAALAMSPRGPAPPGRDRGPNTYYLPHPHVDPSAAGPPTSGRLPPRA